MIASVVHLDNESAVLCVNLAGPESRAVAAEAPVVRFLPAAAIEGVEVVLPVEVEIAGVPVVSLDLEPVVASVPGHASIVEVATPA